MTSPQPGEEPGDGPPVVRVAIHHAQGVWVDTLRRVLAAQEGIEVVEAHTSPGWVQHAVRSGLVDVLLISGGESLATLGGGPAGLPDTDPALRVVCLGERPDARVLTAAVRAGVRGWVEPDVSAGRLRSTLRAVARGETRLPPTVLTEVLDTLTRGEQSRAVSTEALSSLSARESDILGCLAQGLSRAEIAERYVLSPHTVRTHINNVLRKLDVHSTLAAVSMAREGGLLEAGRES
jgi:DNA-binding NarL/FixJ family response regulator